MRILVTNDDGIFAEGLIALVNWAKTIGEVTIFAPKKEQSGKSLGIEIHEPFEVMKVEHETGVEAYSVDSTPADCVRYALFGMNRQFDLVLSGMNNGLNMGVDLSYSATCGAIFEASFQGIPAISFSCDRHSAATAATYFAAVWDFFQEHRLMDRGRLYNVNIPNNVQGFRVTKLGGPYYLDHFVPAGENLVVASGYKAYQKGDDLSVDTDAIANGYISITPLKTDRTDYSLLDDLLIN